MISITSEVIDLEISFNTLLREWRSRRGARCAQLTASPAYRSDTITSREVLVEELADNVLVDPMDIQPVLAHPARKMRNALAVPPSKVS